jgi:UDP-N-acetylmuramate dehydrogenase
MDMEYCGKYNLRDHSAMKIGPVNAKVVYIDNKKDILEALLLAEKEELIPFPLGGGSNTIFSDSVVDKYLFLIPRMSEIETFPRSPLGNLFQGETLEIVNVKIDAGLEWDEAVLQTVELGFSGLEALSWIPGLVGASPVQNIGAYGAEIKDTIHTVHAYDMQEKKFVDFNNEKCEFEYRNSIFKKNPGRYFIYSVTFSLLKISAKDLPSVPQYKDVISYFENKNISSPSLKQIREAIIEIRKTKLPDPRVTPNVGSYFGNPIISKETATKLLENFPEMPMFDFEPRPSQSVIPSSLSSLRMRGSMDSHLHENDKQEHKKLFAGWLIDKARLKGYSKGLPGQGNFSIHPNHALVIIGNGKGNLAELLEFENHIKQKVFEMFGVELVREPVIVE